MTLKTILKAAVNSMIHGHHNPHCYSAHMPGQGYVNNGRVEATRADYLRQLERAAQFEIDNMGFASEYAEVGYDQPRKGILLADWNKLPRGLDTILEKLGFTVEWLDEWANCEGCNRLVRTSPDSYGWRQSYVIYDSGLFCSDCVKNDLDEYEAYLLNHVKLADTFDIDWTARGFIRFNLDHYHQTDNPKEIVKGIPKGHDFLFSIPSVGQFDVYFDCWIREKVK